MAKRVVFAFLALLCLQSLTLAAELTPAITPAELDRAQCQAFAADKPVGPAPAAALDALLGLAPLQGKDTEWATGAQLDKRLSFRIAFTAPVEIGTLLTTYSGGRTPGMPIPRAGSYVAYLKADAAYPGDVANPEQWVVLPEGDVKILPPGTRTRALRFVDQQGEWGYGPGGDHFQTTFRPVLLLKERYYSALDIGHSSKSGGGKSKKPLTWLGSWNEAQAIAGIAILDGQPEAVNVEMLKTGVTTHPVLTVEKDWRQSGTIAAAPGVVLFHLDTAYSTRALRLTAGRFGRIYPLVNLGATPEPPSTSTPPPPFAVKYTMPLDGFTAIDILDKQTGKRVRHLVAEVARDKGVVVEPWDLKDDHGTQLPPGDYLYKGIARPPLKLTYQLTAYNAGQPPWWAPTPGKGGGGWMADHTPPYSACASGDLVFLSSQVNESGDGVIAVDHDGNKVWGETFITGFDIAQRLTADERYVYAINSSVIQRIDTKAQFQAEEIYHFNYTRDLPGCNWDPSHGGIAAHHGKLYVAFSAAPVSWLQSALLADDLDAEHSFPRVWLAKGSGNRAGPLDDRVYGEEVYDELMRFYSAFLTGSTPSKTKTWPSYGLPNSTQGYFGDAPTEGPLSGQLIVAFKQPTSVGTVLLPDARTEVYALKPGAPLPSTELGNTAPDLDAPEGGGDAGALDEDNWVKLPCDGKPGHAAIALAPAGGIKTQALRFKTKRLIFAMVTNHRFDDFAPQAERVYSEGQGERNGAWTISRTADVSVNKFNAPSMALLWKTPVTLRGVVLVQPRGGVMAVDTWIGPADGDPRAALKDDKQWRQLGSFAPEIFGGYFAQVPSVRTIDFGELVETRALRVRALSPPTTSKADVGGPWPANTPVFAEILAYHSLGDDPQDIPPDLSQRISEFQLPTQEKAPAQLLRNVPIKEPGSLLFGKDGTLYGVSAGRIVSLTLDADGDFNGDTKVVVGAGALEQPASLAQDAEGQLYVSDMGPQVVKVFDRQSGKLLRTIGKPGGHKPGLWDANCMDRPTGITIDSADKLWVAHNSYQPKRVSRWSRDGKYEVSFLGPTQYGGGGHMDEGDRSVINYNGMKFVIDWQKMEWRLDSILYRPGPGMSLAGAMPDLAVYCQGHRYLVGNSGDRSVATICTERDHVAVPLAIVGNLGDWAEVSLRPDLMKAFGSLDRAKYGFCWVDRNGDGIPQADEVQITDKFPLRGGAVGEDLAVNFAGVRLRPTEIRADGTPLYDLTKLEVLPAMSDRAWSTTDGRTFTMVDQWDRLLAPDGKTALWDYYDQFGIFAGWYASGFGYDRPAGVLNAEQSIFGHLKAVPAKVGTEDYWVTSSDQGDWFLFTDDGLLVGCVFGGPTGYGLRRWTMPEWTPGKVDLSDLRLQQECYQGHVLKANDNHVYAIAGKNHMSVVRVDGLEELQRLSGPVTVTQADIDATRAWAERKALIEQRQAEAKVARVPYVDTPLTIDGSFDAWPDDLFFTVHEQHKIGFHEDEWVTLSKAALAYDADNLYLAVQALDNAPMRNASENLPTLFKSGDAVDLTLGLDPTADPKRVAAAPGDIRLLISRVQEKPVVMLYRYNVPGLAADQRVHFTSPVGETWVDEVKQIDNAQVVIVFDPGAGEKHADGGWRVTAAIPWKSLGVEAPKIGTHLRGDVGVLQADQNGVQTVNRLYWSGKSQRVVSDLPSEARIAPALWGDFFFSEADSSMKFGPDTKDPLGDGPGLE